MRSPLPILMYHRIGSRSSDWLAQWTLDPHLLDEQLAALRDDGYRSATVGSWAAAAAPEKPVCLTFDDGYADFATTAWPTLRRYGFSATMFVVAGCVGGVNEWNRDAEEVPLLDWDALRELRDDGVELGAHTMSHPRLTDLPPDAALDEMRRSKQLLEDMLEVPVTSFAYPYGAVDEAVIELAAVAGFEHGHTCRHAVATGGERPLDLPRLEVRRGYDAAAVLSLAEGAWIGDV